MNRVKKMFFDLKSWGPLKNFKSRNGSYSGLALSILYMSKNKIKISLDCPFKPPIPLWVDCVAVYYVVLYSNVLRAVLLLVSSLEQVRKK